MKRTMLKVLETGSHTYQASPCIAGRCACADLPLPLREHDASYTRVCPRDQWAHGSLLVACW